MRPAQTFDKERVSFNLAKLKKFGLHFEVAVDPDKAIQYKTQKNCDIREVIRSEHIFTNVKQGLQAAEKDINMVFGTKDVLKIAERIIEEGEIQLTEEFRDGLREQKAKRIVSIIARNAVDPKTDLPHPMQRIMNAMEEAKIKIDEYKSAEDQIDEIVKKLRPILPIRMEIKRISVTIPSQFAGKAYPVIVQFAKPGDEEWHTDGSYSCIIEIPAGLEPDFYEKVNHLTHGNVSTKVVGTR